MRLLIVSNFYTPVLNARSFRWSAIAEEWVNNGHAVDVICAWQPGLARNENINGVAVYRTGSSFLGKLQKNSKISKDGSSSKTSNAFSLDPVHVLKFILKKIYNFTWKKLYWPDFACIWQLSADKKAKQLCKENNYEWLVTVSFPFSSHLVGLKLNAQYSEMKWLVDSGDPFCFNPVQTNNHKLYSSLNKSIERKVFKNADCLTVTTDGTLELYVSIFPEIEKKIVVIPPLVNINKPSQNISKIFPENKKIRISFLGILYPNIREPDGLLEMLYGVIDARPELQELLELHFWGDCKTCMENFQNYPKLTNLITFHGYVSKDTAVSVMYQSDILVNIGNNTSYQLPSKIVEYVVTGKSIINICSIPDDSTRGYLKDYPLILNYDYFEECIEKDWQAILNFIQQGSSRCVPDKIIQNYIAQHCTQTIAKQYLVAMENIFIHRNKEHYTKC